MTGLVGRALLPALVGAALENVNNAVRGWGNYFRYGNSAAKFSAIDGYANERLAVIASAEHGLRSRNWVSRFNYEWTTPDGRPSPQRNGQVHACVYRR